MSLFWSACRDIFSCWMVRGYFVVVRKMKNVLWAYYFYPISLNPSICRALS